jgi:hypothetical protein
MRQLQKDSHLTGARTMVTFRSERCYMRLNLQLLVAVVLLSGSLFASPDHDRGWRDKKPRHSVPEPGSTIMLTLTAGTLVGGMLLRRRIQNGAL